MRLAVAPHTSRRMAAESLDTAGGAGEGDVIHAKTSTPSAFSPEGRPSRYQVGTMPVCHH